MNRNLAFTYFDIRYNPEYPFDKTILPGYQTLPEEPLMGLIKTEDVLWYLESEKDLPKYLATTWDVITPILIDWFNIRFGEKLGVITQVFPARI
jgi:hypothetical protein